MPPDAPAPPQNLDAEEMVLGAMLISPAAIDTVVDILEGREFFRDTHSEVYRAIVSMHSRGRSVDVITVADELSRQGASVSGGRVHELAMLVPAAGNVRHWAEIVRETWLARGLIVTGQEISRLGWDRDGDIEDVYKNADRQMVDLQRLLERRNDSVYTGRQLAEAFLERLKNPPRDSEGVQPAWPFLKSLQPSRLYVLGGYQGTGKTAVGTQFMRAACEGGSRVGFVSLEMSESDITDRIVSLFGVPADQVQSKRIAPEFQDCVNEALLAMNDWDFEVIDDGSLTPADIRRRQRRGKYDLLIIDHLHTIPLKDRKHEREEIAGHVQAITKIAREFEIPVLLLAQLSRGMKHDPYPRPTRRDLFGASQIENDAAHIWFIWRKPDQHNQMTNSAEFIIDKDRFGPTGWQEMAFVASQVRFVPGTASSQL